MTCQAHILFDFSRPGKVRMLTRRSLIQFQRSQNEANDEIHDCQHFDKECTRFTIIPIDINAENENISDGTTDDRRNQNDPNSDIDEQV
jgi:hypothetical protein